MFGFSPWGGGGGGGGGVPFIIVVQVGFLFAGLSSIAVNIILDSRQLMISLSYSQCHRKGTEALASTQRFQLDLNNSSQTMIKTQTGH